MNSPTEEQVKEFWKWCGQYKECGAPRDIDLNNLFEYEPLTAQGYRIDTCTYKREVDGVMERCSWVVIRDPSGTWVSFFTAKELKDALFWALWCANSGGER